MASVVDVAAYIVEKQGSLDCKKLQKLVYYCQAWSLVWSGEPLFLERIEAWRDGPVVPRLYALHRGTFQVSSNFGGQPSNLTPLERDIVDSVLAFYAQHSTEALVAATHNEKPWQDARRGLLPLQPGRREITIEAIRTYFSTLVGPNQAATG